MPMNKTEYLLECLSEECCEVAVRVSKALRFTLEEAQPGQMQTNAKRIFDECVDVIGCIEKLVEEGVINNPMKEREGIEEKKAKINKFMKYSREIGCLV